MKTKRRLAVLVAAVAAIALMATACGDDEDDELQREHHHGGLQLGGPSGCRHQGADRKAVRPAARASPTPSTRRSTPTSTAWPGRSS